MKNVIIVCLIFFSSCSKSQIKKDISPKAKVSFQDYETLITEVKNHRAERLISLSEFLKKSQDENTIILDTRSKLMYDRKHVKGAVHLNFSDFNQNSLKRLIPDLNTKILIYCNNNFSDDAINFMSKTVLPLSINNNEKEVMLALNVPTYINLYGYGYKNVYELEDHISVLNKQIQLEGTTVLNFKNYENNN